MRKDILLLISCTATGGRSARPYAAGICRYLRNRELVSDRQGRNTGEPTTGDGVEGRHGFEPTTAPQRHVEYEFARAVADYLDDELRKNSFHGIAVVAAPNMLGDLRELMSEGLRAAVTIEIPKDLTQLDEFALEKHLRQHEGV